MKSGIVHSEPCVGVLRFVLRQTQAPFAFTRLACEVV
jgi:hypothetical protein